MTTAGDLEQQHCNVNPRFSSWSSFTSYADAFATAEYTLARMMSRLAATVD